MCFRKVCLAHTDSGGRNIARSCTAYSGRQKALEDKLEYLKNVRRAEIARRSHCALSFRRLKRKCGIRRREDATPNRLRGYGLTMLKNIVIIDGNSYRRQTVTMGSIVRIKFVDLGFEDGLRLSVLPERISTQTQGISNDSLSALRF